MSEWANEVVTCEINPHLGREFPCPDGVPSHHPNTNVYSRRIWDRVVAGGVFFLVHVGLSLVRANGSCLVRASVAQLDDGYVGTTICATIQCVLPGQDGCLPQFYELTPWIRSS